MPELDADGYPFEEDLQRIREWPITNNYAPLLDFIGERWSYPDRWEKVEAADDVLDKPVWRYTCSTGGWSGNESLIYALQDNCIAWSMCWAQSRRGGHYIFEVRRGA